MLDNPSLNSLAEKVLDAITSSDEVLDAALEAYIDKHPELAEATSQGEYTSDYHDIFEEAIDTVVGKLVEMRHPNYQ